MALCDGCVGGERRDATTCVMDMVDLRMRNSGETKQQAALFSSPLVEGLLLMSLSSVVFLFLLPPPDEGAGSEEEASPTDSW